MSRLPAAYATAPVRRRPGRASVARGIAASFSAALLTACALAVALQAMGAAADRAPGAAQVRTLGP